jgi:mxaJ protein
MSSPFRISLLATLAAGLLVSAPACADALRVCADPNNLPYSNEHEDGFENRIARILADDLKIDLRYTWWAQQRGYIERTIGAGSCDVLIGVPEDFSAVTTTRPYYRSGYMFVTASARKLAIASLDDPQLRALRVGVQTISDEASSPPAHALANRGIVENLRAFTIYGDYTDTERLARILRSVAAGEIDVAAVWGPQAGYFIRHDHLPLSIAPITPELDGALPMVFDIALGVRSGDDALRDRLQSALDRHREEIDRILDGYAIPRLDPAGKLLGNVP